MVAMPTTTKNILTVSQLNARAQQALEAMGTVWIEGEISNHVRASSGHHYFSLKDANAQVSAAFFRFQANRVRFAVRDGVEVLVRAKVSLYSPRGNYQIIVEHMELAGEGRLRQQFEALKAKLAAEGLFAEDRKRPLPVYPRHIGLITSPSGAALQDMLKIFSHHSPHIPITLYPSLVQGQEAPAALREALSKANAEAKCDVLVIGRGGGSLEDLWAFNDEALTREVAASAIPIISAVGHEIDFCLTDFAADWRAPTPTAAAEQLARGSAQLPRLLEQYQQRLITAVAQRIEQLKAQTNHLERRLRHPAAMLRQHQQQLDELERRLQRQVKLTIMHLQQRQQAVAIRLPRATLHQLRGAKFTLTGLSKRLQSHSPQQRLRYFSQRLEQSQQRLPRPVLAKLVQAEQQTTLLSQRLPKLMQQAQAPLAQRLALAASRLESSSPLAVLARGYGITFHGEEHVRSIKQLSAGDVIRQRLEDGSFTAEVKSLLPQQD